MNFKFTKSKVIGSVILALVLDIIFLISDIVLNNNPLLPGGMNIFIMLFYPINLILLLGILIIVYVLWSIFQKINCKNL